MLRHPEQWRKLTANPAGVHFCLGAVLARMELTACFQALARRMPGLRFDPERPAIPRRTSLVFKGFETLPVLF